MKLKELAQAWDCSNDEFAFASYYDRDQDKVIILTDEDLQSAYDYETEDDLEALPESKRDYIRMLWDAVYDGDRMILLPQNKTHETYELMKSFAYTLDHEQREVILQWIQGKGAFRRFDRAIDSFGIREAWYAYRDLGFEKIIEEWCDRCEIPYQASPQASSSYTTKDIQLTIEDQIDLNIVGFIQTIHMNGQNFVEEAYDSAYYGELPMTFKKKQWQLFGLITAKVEGESRKYIFNEYGYERLDEILALEGQ